MNTLRNPYSDGSAFGGRLPFGMKAPLEQEDVQTGVAPSLSQAGDPGAAWNWQSKKWKRGTARVPGKDTGEDTVPAMLRPGEGVVTKEAMEQPGMREFVAEMNEKHKPSLRQAARAEMMERETGVKHAVAGDEDLDLIRRKALPPPPGQVVPFTPAPEAGRVIDGTATRLDGSHPGKVGGQDFVSTKYTPNWTAGGNTGGSAGATPGVNNVPATLGANRGGPTITPVPPVQPPSPPKAFQAGQFVARNAPNLTQAFVGDGIAAKATGAAKAVGNGVLMPSPLTVAAASADRLLGENKINFTKEGYDTNDYSEGARGRGLGRSFRDLAIAGGDAATRFGDMLNPMSWGPTLKNATGGKIGWDDPEGKYSQINDLYRSGVGLLDGVDAKTTKDLREEASLKAALGKRATSLTVNPTKQPTQQPVQESVWRDDGPGGYDAAGGGYVQPIDYARTSKAEAGRLGLKDVRVLNKNGRGDYGDQGGIVIGRSTGSPGTGEKGRTTLVGIGNEDVAAREAARVQRANASDADARSRLDNVLANTYGSTSLGQAAQARITQKQVEANKQATLRDANRANDNRLMFDMLKYGDERKDKAAATAAAATKAGIEDFDNLVKESGYKGDEATAFTDWFRGNYAGRKHMIDGKEVMVPGFENMTAAEKRAHMTNAKGMYELKKREVANTMRGKPSMGMAASAREDDLTYDDWEKNSIGLPKAFGSDPSKVGIFGPGGVIFRKTPKWLGGEGDEKVIRFLDDQGRTTHTVAKNRLSGAAGPWQAGDTERYLKSLENK